MVTIARRTLRLTPTAPTEASEQAAVIDWWRSYAPTRQIDPRLLMASAGGSVLWGDDKHRAIQANRMKRAGYRNGTPDLFLAKVCWARGISDPWRQMVFAGLFVELKRKDGTESDESTAQREMIDLMRRQGYNAVICYGADECVRAIRAYLGDTP